MTVGILLGVYMLLLLAVNVGPVQREMARMASETLSEMTGCRVKVEAVEVELFNAVTLENVSVWDIDGNEMLKSPYLSGKIEILPLFSGEIKLSSITLLDTYICLAKDSKNELNLQPFIDAFSSDNKEKKPLNLSVNSLIIRRGTVDLDESLINIKNVKISDIDLNLSLKKLTDDEINLKLRKLALKVSNGLEIKDLSLDLEANREQAVLRNLNFEMPHTQVRQNELKFTYDAKDFVNTLRVKTTLDKWIFGLEDLACVVPVMNRFPHQLVLNGAVEYAEKQLQIDDLSIRERSDDGIFNLQTAQLKFDLDEPGNMRMNAHKLNVLVDASQLDLAADIRKLGQVQVMGDVALGSQQPLNIRVSDLRALTAMGEVKADGTYNEGRIEGKILTDGLKLEGLSDNANVPKFIAGNVAGQFNLKSMEGKGRAEVKQIVWRGVTYDDMKIEGAYQNGNITAKVNSHDDDCRMTADVNARTDLSQLRVEANVENFNLQPFTTKFKQVQGQISAQVNGLRSACPTGEVEISDVKLDDFVLNSLYAQSEAQGDGVKLHVTSDILDGEFSGPLDWPNLKATALSFVHRNLPQLVTTNVQPSKSAKWDMALKINNIEPLKKLVDLPLDLEDALSLYAHIDMPNDEANCHIVSRKMTVKDVDLKDVDIKLSHDDEGLKSRIGVTKPMKNRDLKLNINSCTSDEKLLTDILWGETSAHYHGELKTETQFLRQNDGGMGVALQILPAEMAIGDTLWTLDPGKVTWLDKRLTINNLSVRNKAGNALRINGIYSKSDTDSMVIDLKNVDIAYIIGFTNFDDVTFDGLATGRGVVRLDPKNPDVHLDVKFPRLCLNEAPLGQAHVKGSFEFDNKEIGLDVDLNDVGYGETFVDGFINLSEKRMQLDIDGTNTNLGFIQHFVTGIFEDFEGRATGHCRLWGPLKKLDLDGDEKATAAFTIPAIGTHFNISSVDVSLREGQIFFGNAQVNDGRQGTGVANGQLLHNKLKNLRYSFEIDANNLLGYDQKQEVGSNMYCTAFGSGHVLLYGSPGQFTADINVRPEKGTSLTYIVDTPETVSTDGRLVKFNSKNPTAVTDEKGVEIVQSQDDDSRTDVMVNFTIDANPQAQLRLLMDEKTGDVITLYGDGVIRASWYNKGAFQMWGTYTVDHGDYRMSIQDIIRKNFKFQQGSSLTFTGVPMEGDLDLKAVYTVNSASLADLSGGSNLFENSVRVNCIMNIGGKAKSPEVTFDLDLPTVNEDEKQMIRRLVSTQEDMNMQIIYLLGVGRFYNQDYAATAGENQQTQSATAVNSFISNTLSSQLNELISNAMQTQNWTFGANFATGTNGWSDMEVEALLSGRLFNNRLLINGQFGYRDRPTYSSSQFIGDFDIQYLLTKNGNVTLKAYSETNDRYFTKSSLTTQGIGINLKRNFNNVKELFIPSKILNRKKK